MFKNVSIAIFLLLVCFAGGCRQNSKPKISGPYVGMSDKDFFELCGSTDDVILEENIDKGRIIYTYKEEAVNYSGCRGKFIFETDNLTSIYKN